MSQDHRFHYTPLQMYTVGSRFTDDFEIEDAVQCYVKLHPEADAMAVQLEIKMQMAALEQEHAARHVLDKPKENYSVRELLAANWRYYRQPRYGMEDAFREYLQLHPSLNEEDVRADVAREIAQEEADFQRALANMRKSSRSK